MTREEWSEEMRSKAFTDALHDAVGERPFRRLLRDLALVVSVVALVGVGITLGRASGQIGALRDSIDRHEQGTAQVCAAQQANVDVQLQDIRRRLDFLERRALR